jgi:hypothetical protein
VFCGSLQNYGHFELRADVLDSPRRREPPARASARDQRWLNLALPSALVLPLGRASSRRSEAPYWRTQRREKSAVVSPLAGTSSLQPDGKNLVVTVIPRCSSAPATAMSSPSSTLLVAGRRGAPSTHRYQEAKVPRLWNSKQSRSKEQSTTWIVSVTSSPY